MAPKQPEPGDIEGIEEAAKAAEETAKRHPFRTGLIVGALVTLASVVLIIQNTNDVQLKWLFLDFSWPLWLILLISFAAGIVAWQLLLHEYRRLAQRASERRAAARTARQAAKKLRNQT